MKNKDIFISALHLLAENDGESDISDYEERFPYLLANFCNDAEELDVRYRKSRGLPEMEEHSYIMLPPDEDFPLSEIFASSAVYYVASMLISDENTEFSDTLFERFSSRMADIYASLPWDRGSIKNIY